MFAAIRVTRVISFLKDWELVLKNDKSQDHLVCESESSTNRNSDNHSSDDASNENILPVVKPSVNELASETDEAISDAAVR